MATMVMKVPKECHCGMCCLAPKSTKSDESRVTEGGRRGSGTKLTELRRSLWVLYQNGQFLRHLDGAERLVTSCFTYGTSGGNLAPSYQVL